MADERELRSPSPIVPPDDVPDDEEVHVISSPRAPQLPAADEQDENPETSQAKRNLRTLVPLGPHGEESGEEIISAEKVPRARDVLEDFSSSPIELRQSDGHVEDTFVTRGRMTERKIEIPTPDSSGPQGIPKSSYYVGPPGVDTAFGTDPCGQIGLHHPREILRVERDYSSGELPQFFPTFPLELEGRVTPTQFQETINDVNEILISAHSITRSVLENVVSVATVYISTLFMENHYDKEMRRLKLLIQEKNERVFEPAGLRILWPHSAAFLFLEIEYY